MPCGSAGAPIFDGTARGSAGTSQTVGKRPRRSPRVTRSIALRGSTHASRSVGARRPAHELVRVEPSHSAIGAVADLGQWRRRQQGDVITGRLREGFDLYQLRVVQLQGVAGVRFAGDLRSGIGSVVWQRVRSAPFSVICDDAACVRPQARIERTRRARSVRWMVPNLLLIRCAKSTCH